MISSPSVQTCVCVCTRVCTLHGTLVFTKAVSIACSVQVPTLACAHTLCPRWWPHPRRVFPQFPSLLHPTMASCPVHIPSGPMPATLGQSLPAPWAPCPAASYSKRQEDLILCGLMFAWPQSQVGGETGAGVQAILQEGSSGPVLAQVLCNTSSLPHLLSRLHSPGIHVFPKEGIPNFLLIPILPMGQSRCKEVFWTLLLQKRLFPFPLLPNAQNSLD